MKTPDPHQPTPTEYHEGVQCKNALPCSICGAPAHRMLYGFQCSVVSGHVADLTTGIFDDLSE